MLSSYVITLREGLEAFLIIAISLAYLRKSGRARLVPAIYWGVAASVVVSIIAAVFFARAANQALWEGILALVAAAMVASLTVHMWRSAKHLKGNIEQHLGDAARSDGRGALFGVFVFTLFMITREGMETALLMNVLFRQIQSIPLIVGAVAGILTGSLVIEKIFAIPGLGTYFVQAALNRDYTLAMGCVLFYTLLVYVMNLLVDISYTILDPRVRLD